jgi:predicted acyltransferase
VLCRRWPAGLLARWLDWRWLLGACAALLLGYWLILLGFSLPGMAFDKFGNAGTRLDLFLLGPDHLYKKDGGFDPEGLLGTLPAIVNVLAGYLTGLAIQRGHDLEKLLRRMMAAGAALIGLALLWSPSFPIAKKLWTGPYVLLTVGIDLIALAAIVMLVDVCRFTQGQRFFTILGRNPMAIYLFSELFVTTLNMVPMGRTAGSMTGWGSRCSSPSHPARWARCSAPLPIRWPAGPWAGRWTAKG